MGRYVSNEQIKKRLEGKVEFGGPGSQDENKLNPDLLNSLINEGETRLEIDLMNRYEVPFQPAAGGAFAQLPNATKTILSLLAELLCVVRVLETDFGRGTSSNSEKYTDALQKRYDKLMGQLVEKKKRNGEETMIWKLPPLPGLKLAYMNQGDTGFQGRVMHVSELCHESAGKYAAFQINDPSRDFFDMVDGEVQ